MASSWLSTFDKLICWDVLRQHHVLPAVLRQEYTSTSHSIQDVHFRGVPCVWCAVVYCVRGEIGIPPGALRSIVTPDDCATPSNPGCPMNPRQIGCTVCINVTVMTIIAASVTLTSRNLGRRERCISLRPDIVGCKIEGQIIIIGRLGYGASLHARMAKAAWGMLYGDDAGIVSR